MTDLEVYINTRGFLDYLHQIGDVEPGDPIALAQDLREVDPSSGLSSSPRIALAVTQAIRDAGLSVVNCGKIPTPALAYYALREDAATSKRPMPGIMVTGSHVPADRNGIKFYKQTGEVLKSDEAGILAAVKAVRIGEYAKDASRAAFAADGMLKTAPEPAAVQGAAEAAYLQRYLGLFPDEKPLAGKRVVVYQHSAVGRDLLVFVLESLGATAIAVARSVTFVPVDTEDLREEDERRFRVLASRHSPDAIISTDGDGDRPVLVDEHGRFHRGDVLGIITAEFFDAAFAAVPINTTDALDKWVHQSRPEMVVEKTRIGSPYVIAAMQRAIAAGTARVVAWEANGGFLIGTDFTVNGRLLSALATRDAVLPILAALLTASRRGVPVSQLFDELPQRATCSGLLDDFPQSASQAILARISPVDATVIDAVFDDSTVTVTRVDNDEMAASAPDPLADELLALRQTIQHNFSAGDGFGSVVRLNYTDGVRVWFDTGDIVHIRPSGNAPQLRVYAVSDVTQRADGMVRLAIREPDGLLRRMEHDLARTGGPTSASPADATPRVSEAQAAKFDNLRDLRRVVNASLGPGQVITIANGGDSEIVSRNLGDLAVAIFRADNAVELMVHEERTRRGQLLGLLDAVRQWRREGRMFDPDGVALGIMLPGKGTRLSPITQRLHGIKPFMPLLVRQGRDGRWLNAAAASLYTWTLPTHHLQRMGFRGIAWKWGDEPQIAAHRLAEMNLDLSRADAVRFGAEVEVTEDLAVNKEWLLRHPTGSELILQVRRRSRAELLQRFDLVDGGQPAKALAHIGSPAFSYPFLEEAEAIFGDLDGWIDVDGYLFEALTHDADAWQAELNRDAGLRQLVTERPDFYERVQELKRRVAERRGHPLVIKVVDFGEHLYWDDIGQLAKARRALWAVAAPTVEGEFARCLAAIDHVAPDTFGNRIVGNTTLPSDGRVRNSVIIDTGIHGKADMEGAVLVESELGDVVVRGGGVAFGCTVGDLDLGEEGLAFMSIQQSLKVPAHHVHIRRRSARPWPGHELHRTPARQSRLLRG
jgi:phosphomannomutase